MRTEMIVRCKYRRYMRQSLFSQLPYNLTSTENSTLVATCLYTTCIIKCYCMHAAYADASIKTDVNLSLQTDSMTEAD
jgi:hypothetical protein